LQKPMTLPKGAVVQGQNGERYMIEGLLGQGGVSAVYLVRNRRNKTQLLALKELINPDAWERGHLAFEAELLMRLEHTSLPHIYRVFENVKLQRVYMVMDYIEGKNLEVLREEQPDKRFSLPLTLALMTPIVHAISYLHAQKPPVIHRDIKPANIIVPVGAGETVLVDFGIAKEYVEEKTTNVFRFGTPGYAAPEQYGQGTNLRTDIYALAATCYTLLTGYVPVDALTRSVELSHKDPLIPIHQICPHISIAVSTVIERAMKLRSEERYATVSEFWDALYLASQQPVFSTSYEVASKVVYPRMTTAPERKKLTGGNIIRKQAERHISLAQGRAMLFRSRVFLLVALLIVGISFGSLLVAQFWQHGSTNVSTVPARKQEVRQQQAAEIHVSGCPLPSFTPVAPVTPLYIQTVPAYVGKISDNVASVSTENHGTAMCLTDVRQKGDQISGRFSGLSFISTFGGTVTQDQVHFTVAIGSDRTYDFQGGIRSVGDMAGQYHIFDSTGQDLGEGGVWEVVPLNQVT
jgi:serine/threonine protein kinase